MTHHDHPQFDVMLRERGYEPWLADGFVSILAVSMFNGTFCRVAGRRAEYMRGTPADPDAEVLPAMIFSTVEVTPLSSVQFDIVDTIKRTVSRMDWIDGSVGTVVAFDASSGEGELVGEQLRQIFGAGLMWFRAVSDSERTKPLPSQSGKFEMNVEALMSAFAARVGSNQVLVDRAAEPNSRRVLLNGLRQAAQPAAAKEDALTRALAWSSEIALRPLVQPCVRLL